MDTKRKIYNLLVRAKEVLGVLRNIIPFKFWKVQYQSFPKIRGKIFLNNYGTIKLGNNVMINSNLESSQLGFYPRTIFHTGRNGTIVLEDNVGLSNVTLYARDEITIKKGARLGAGVKIYDNDFHDLYHEHKNEILEKIPTKAVIVGENAFIGAGTIVLKGVHIGENAIVGAGSVVTRNVPDNEVWAGNPACYIKSRCQKEKGELQ